MRDDTRNGSASSQTPPASVTEGSSAGTGSYDFVESSRSAKDRGGADAADPGASLAPSRPAVQLRGIEFFVALAQERHFARAASLCSVAQPTLSIGLAALEEALGGSRLVERDRRFLGLTAAGEMALPWARALLADLRSLQEAVEPAAHSRQGKVRLGVTSDSMAAATGLIRSLLAEQPEISIAIETRAPEQIVSALQAREIDLGVTCLQGLLPPYLRRAPLQLDPYLFGTRSDGADGDRWSVSWREEKLHPLALLNEGMSDRQVLDTFAANRGVRLKPAITTDNYPALIDIVSQGGFSTIIPRSFVPAHFSHSHLRFVPFDDPPPAKQIDVLILDRPAVNAAAEAVFRKAGHPDTESAIQQY